MPDRFATVTVTGVTLSTGPTRWAAVVALCDAHTGPGAPWRETYHKWRRWRDIGGVRVRPLPLD